LLGADTIEREAAALPVPAGTRQPAATSWPRQQARADLLTGFRKAMADAIAARRTFVLLPFAMIFGLVGYVALPEEPNGWALAGVGLAIALAAIGLTRTAWLPADLLISGLWLGVCLLVLHGQWFGTEMLIRPAYGTYEMRVDEVLSQTDEQRRIVVSDFVPIGEDRALPIEKARLVTPSTPPLAVGDIISARIRLAPVPGPVLPGSYDGQFASYFGGIGAYGTVTGDFALVRQAQGFDALRVIEQVRSGIGMRIDAVLEGSTAAIGRAMVMGDQSAIDDETRDVMAESGLAHIYSISGLHLSIVAGGMFWLVRLGLAALPVTATRWPVKRIAAVAGLVAAMGYMLLAGGLANVPALRSTIMLALVFGAVLAGRRALTMRNVAIAAIAIILIDPASVFRPSFQLSFAAVVALIGVYEMPRKVRDRAEQNWLQRTWSVTWATAATSFIAGAATLLFSAYHFQQTAPLGVLGNVLVLPVVSLIIMPFAVISVLAMPFGVEAPFLAVMGWGIDRMVDGAVLVAGWSHGLTGNPLLTGWALFVGLAALAWFSFFKDRWRFIGPAIAVPVILLFCFDQRPDVLIADTTQAVAVRGEEGFGMVTGKTGSFAVDVWADTYQEPIAAELDGTRCDSLGCITTTERFSAAVVRNAAAFAEDCGAHDLLVARVRVPEGCGGLVIDADDLAAGGVQWLRWTGDGFDVRRAIPEWNRPWRLGYGR
jgi:competence protein ComEC